MLYLKSTIHNEVFLVSKIVIDVKINYHVWVSKTIRLLVKKEKEINYLLKGLLYIIPWKIPWVGLQNHKLISEKREINYLLKMLMCLFK